MNFAQLIDSSWVRDGARERMPAKPSGAQAPVEPVVRTHRHEDDTPPPSPTGANGAQRKILRVLSTADRPLKTAEIAALDGTITKLQVAGNAIHLHDRKAVRRIRCGQAFEYVITESGRAEL